MIDTWLWVVTLLAEHPNDNNLVCLVYWWTCCHLACRAYYSFAWPRLVDNFSPEVNKWVQLKGHVVQVGRRKLWAYFNALKWSESPWPKQRFEMQPVGFYRCWYILMMHLWCSTMSKYIYRRAWRSPFNIIWCGGSISSIQWCVGSLFNIRWCLDLWCQIWP